MGVLCASSQGAALKSLVDAPAKVTASAASSALPLPGFASGRTAKALRSSRECLTIALKGGLSQGLGNSCAGISRKRELRLTQTAISATTESSETVEDHQEQGDVAVMNSSGCETLCTTTWGLCDTVIGVLGGGQLGRMLCQAASPMGIKVSVLDPLEDCPAGNIAYHYQVGSFKDMQAVREFAKGCGALTVEIEHVNVETLEALARENVDIEPKPFTIRIIQDKYMQKMHFKKHDVALPEFMKIDSAEEAEEAGKLFGYPLMLKSRRDAYDGRGNAVVESREALPLAISSLGGIERCLYAEKWAPFVKELAIMVARGRDGSIRSFPVVETTHVSNICHTVEAPARIPKEVAELAMQVAERAVGSLSGAGMFGVELFLLKDGNVLLNEVAPRPHNCGHYTIESCFVSQYEQHLRCVLGLPLGDPSMKVPAALMYNILGEADGEEGFTIAHNIMRRAMSVPGASVHWYEKPEIRKQRKMGHITVVGPTAEVVRARMNWIINTKGIQDYPKKKPSFVSGVLPSNVATALASSSEDAKPSGPPVGIIMGSDSDLPVMSAAAEILDSFGIPYELTVVSAHRTPERMVSYAQTAHKRGVKVIIAGAGGAAHLPGMVASLTPLPVIGVPVKGSHTDGLDSLLSIVQMPRGIPVATVAIQNATNAGLLAVRMLGVESDQIVDKMAAYQNSLKDMVLEKAERLETIGWKEYLK
uniref:phosphoribosylaminoimidazole carboxylase n=1 Tax=Physcomitrium patens TaxID=3218 RepID=A5A0Q9_PHYPA|nr:aminoimidazole ribonucleotide carboxylase [Physcomitrium patens]